MQRVASNDNLMIITLTDLQIFIYTVTCSPLLGLSLAKICGGGGRILPLTYMFNLTILKLFRVGGWVAGWVAGREVIIRLTQSSWSWSWD
jgi:hypothetical protein